MSTLPSHSLPARACATASGAPRDASVTLGAALRMPLRQGWRILLQRLRGRHGTPRRRVPTAWFDEAAPEPTLHDDAPPRGCGWFDSSQDLREGLSVSEHAGSDALAAQLPLAAWVDLQLCGWRPALPALEG